jgi:vitamin B12 transporter
LAVACAVVVSFPAVAQDAPPAKPPADAAPSKDPQPQKEKDVVVTASRLDEPSRDVASDVTVIPASDISNAQQRMLSTALREVPALDVNQSGGLGGLTSVFIRGANSGQTLVLIDGVIVNDPISADRGFDFANLTTDNIDRVEVLRGPQSVLYGSDAIGGVINVITRRGQGDPHATFTLEGGSFATYRGSAAVSGGSGMVNYSFGASHAQSAGISSAASDLGNTERDGYRNDTFSGRIGVTPAPWFDVDVMARGTQSRADEDNGGGAGMDDPNRVLSVDQYLFRVAPRTMLFDGFWEQTLAFSVTSYDTHDDNPPDGQTGGAYSFSVFRSRLVVLDWQNTLRIQDSQALVVGLTFRQENGESSTASFDPVFGPFVSVLGDQSAWIRSAYGEYRIHLWDRLTASAGARVDDHKEFGTHGTYRGTAAYVLEETDTKLRSTIGTGFKAPSLFELYSSFGNPDLKPEESMGWDVGFDQGIANRTVVASVSYFRNNFTNLIDFDSAASKYFNTGRAGTSGVEAAVKIVPVKELEVRLSYTFTDTKDKDTGEELLRRARHKAAVRADYAVTEKLHVNGSYLYVGARQDLAFDPVTFVSSPVTLPDYALLNLAASYKVTEKISLFIRGDNVLNRRYQEVFGFGTPGAAVYGGATVEF